MSRAIIATMRIFGSMASSVRKHPEAYREHLLDLYLRRAWTFGTLCRDVEALEQEVSDYLEPAVRERGLELQRAATRLTAVLRAASVEALEVRLATATGELEAATGALEAELTQSAALRKELADSHAEYAALELHSGGLRAESERLSKACAALARDKDEARAVTDAVRRSYSWRMSAPLRRLYEWLRLGSRASYDR